MKPVKIVSVGIGSFSGLAELDSSPLFRKATVNMKLAHLALLEAFATLNLSPEKIHSDMALFLGTSHGEFNSTLDFLKSWAQQKLARPFVFQNSLHNSTTGFIALNQGIKAPACTVSHHDFSGEDALDMAQQFLITGMSPIAVVVGAEARTGEYLPLLQDAGFPHQGWGQGAAAVVLATEEYCSQNNLPVLGDFLSVSNHPCLDRPVHVVLPEFDLSQYYDSQAVENFAMAIKNKTMRELVTCKPNGGFSRLHWAPALET